MKREPGSAESSRAEPNQKCRVPVGIRIRRVMMNKASGFGQRKLSSKGLGIFLFLFFLKKFEKENDN